jgi:hypothetical protein
MTVTCLTENDRAWMIEELMEKINPLNLERVLMITRSNLLRANHKKNASQKTKLEIIQLDQQIRAINRRLINLTAELRKYQVLYEIEFEQGIFKKDRDESKGQLEYLYLRTNFEIDTARQGWEPYLQCKELKHLIIEIQQYRYDNRFLNFNFRNIRRVE